MILLVGYQAGGTLGRRLAEGAKKVKIFGLEHEVRASVRMMHNFSSHADQNDLLWFIQGLSPRPQKIFLVHGEYERQQALQKGLQELGRSGVEIPTRGQKFEI